MDIFNSFNELDWIFAAFLLISTLVGLSRGMVREIFTLGGWAAAFFVSVHYSGLLAEKLPIASLGPLAKSIISIAIIIIVCVFAAGILGKMFRSLLSSISIGAEDRILGCVFGFLRGLVIVGILVYLGGLSQFVSNQVWWKQSVLIPWFEKGILMCKPYLPESLLEAPKNIKNPLEN